MDLESTSAASETVAGSAVSSTKPQSRPGKSIWYRITRILVYAYLAILLMMVLLESRLVFPGAYQSIDARDWDDGRDDIEVFPYKSEDGVSLTGQLIRRDDARPLLFFHGNGTKAVWSRDFIRRLSKATGCTVLAVEYRGFADDGHPPNESGIVMDCIAAFDALANELSVPPSSIVLYGSSLGGGCAAAVAEVRPVGTLVLERSFDSLVNVAGDLYWFLPVKLLMQNRFDSAKRLADYRGRVLQIHGDVDSIVPIQRARALERTLTTPDAVFKNYPQLGHNDRLEDDVLTLIGDWIRG